MRRPFAILLVVAGCTLLAVLYVQRPAPVDLPPPAPAAPACSGPRADLPLVQFPLSVTSRNIKGGVKTVADLPLLKFALPSIVKTVEPWRARYWVAIAADSGDPWYDNGPAQAAIAAWYEAEWAARWPGLCAPRLTFDVYNNTHSCNVRAVNYVSMRGLLEGADYFYRINDDTVLHGDSNWTSLFIEALAGMRPIANLGVVGPADAFQKDALLTHCCVHRNHFTLWSFHFAPLFCNWWSDNWIQAVYAGPYPTSFGREPNMMSIMKQVRVTHKVLPSRYDIKSTNDQYLKQVAIDRVERDRVVENCLETKCM